MPAVVRCTRRSSVHRRSVHSVGSGGSLARGVHCTDGQRQTTPTLGVRFRNNICESRATKANGVGEFLLGHVLGVLVDTAEEFVALLLFGVLGGLGGGRFDL